MATGRGHGWWPYLAPYGLFLIAADLGSRLPDGAQPGVWLFRVFVPGLLMLAFAWRGAYPELRGYRLGAATLGDVAVGLGVVALWIGPFLLFPGLERPAPEAGFDAGVLGAGREDLALAIRLMGFAVFTPFLEELFVRSFLLRYADVADTGEDFRRQPIGRYRARSFLVTVVWFTFTHASWEWIVAAPTCVVLNLWLYQRGHLGAVIVAHAVANGAIGALVVFGPAELAVFL